MNALALTTLPPHLAASPNKRNRFSPQARRREGLRLLEILRSLEAEHPGFSEYLAKCIEQIDKSSLRTRRSDRQCVLGALKEWEIGLTVKEIMDETGLSHWDVRQILSDLQTEGMVTRIPETRDWPHHNVLTYRLTHKT